MNVERWRIRSPASMHAYRLHLWHSCLFDIQHLNARLFHWFRGYEVTSRSLAINFIHFRFAFAFGSIFALINYFRSVINLLLSRPTHTHTHTPSRRWTLKNRLLNWVNYMRINAEFKLENLEIECFLHSTVSWFEFHWYRNEYRWLENRKMYIFLSIW